MVLAQTPGKQPPSPLPTLASASAMPIMTSKGGTWALFSSAALASDTRPEAGRNKGRKTLVFGWDILGAKARLEREMIQKDEALPH